MFRNKIEKLCDKFIPKKIKPAIYLIAGSFIIAAGWSWYHIFKHPKWVFLGKALLVWAAVYIGYRLFKIFYVALVRRFNRHEFWRKDFLGFLDKLFLSFSFLFGVFFLRNEFASLIYVSAALAALFWQLNRYLARHPDPRHWLTVNKSFFMLAYFLFIVEATAQYTAHYYYILDSNSRFFNIVLFRSVAMTLFWLFGFVAAGFLYWRIRSFWRYLPMFIWSLFFLAVMALWVVNIGILYYSGLYFSPVALEHLAGSGDVITNGLTWYLILGYLLVLALFGLILKKIGAAHRNTPQRYWHFYNIAVGFIALLSFFGLTSFRNTPEHAVIKSFYDYFLGKDEKIALSGAIQAKLQKFGLNYDENQFYVNQRDRVFTSTQKFIPERLLKNKPNLIILFLESYSARLTDVYNPGFTDLTPGLDAMVSDAHTTVFKKYFNASTPTITGSLSQLCSFLPPTGHNEIENERKLQNHHLLCLPEVLKKQAGFKYASYITAVDKEYANKEGIFSSMGVDKIYGTSELKKHIPGEPLAWGYSDHQMFPALWNFMKDEDAQGNQPFLMMLATVDTHPPFNLAKDEVKYKDGNQPVLNSFHTTDDAFAKFWNEFKQSKFYDNTIVVAVADHAIFPAALTRDIFPEEAGKLTYYDENTFLTYIPDSVLPREVDRYSSGLDLMPTLLQILNINIPNSFEGHSIFDDRKDYPNLLGMHELGLYINQVTATGKRKVDYNVPTEIECAAGYVASSTPDLTLCDYLEFYKWKRQMFEEGRFWKKI